MTMEAMKSVAARTPVEEVAMEHQRNDDAHWAQHDPQVQELYAGQWVVALNHRIVAHGSDPRAVLVEGCKVTQKSSDELTVCAVPHPDSWLADA
jgi:hypothetical protein